MRRTRTLLLTAAVALIAAGVSLIGLGMSRPGEASFAQPQVTGLSISSPATVTPPPTTDPAAQARADRRKRVAALDAALARYARTVPEFSVAVLDRATGERYSYRGGEHYETASVVKVEVLACLLLRAQDNHRDLTATELSLAKRMIRHSDNNATTSLFTSLGQAPAVTASNKRMGLRDTVVDNRWGLTKTTVDDQVKLLSKLVDPRGPLDAESRSLAHTLMTTVAPEQRWGVSAAARPGETVAIKNGWDTRTADGGRWAINSVGRITAAHVDVSVAVLSHGHRSQGAGIAVVEKVARMTRTYLKW